MKTLFTIFIFIVFTITVHSQGSFLEIGQSAFSIGGGFSSNKDVTGFGGSVSYSVSGIFDFGVSIDHFSFKQQLLDEGSSATVISPSIAFYALKQNEDNPFSFAIGAGYEWQNYSNDVHDEYNIDMTGSFFSIGASLFGYYTQSIYMRIQPSISFTYVTGEIKVKDNNGNEETEDDNATVFGFGLSLGFDISPKNIFAITPRVSYSEGTSSFGLGLAFIFSTN